MDAAQRIRRRNTAYVQIGTAAAALVVGAILAYVDWKNYTDPWRVVGSLVVFAGLAIWMVRRGRRGLRALRS